MDVLHLSPSSPSRAAETTWHRVHRQLPAASRVVAWTAAGALLLAIQCAWGAINAARAEDAPVQPSESVVEPLPLPLPELRVRPRLTAGESTVESVPVARWEPVPPAGVPAKNNAPLPIGRVLGVAHLQPAMPQLAEPPVGMPYLSVRRSGPQATTPPGLRPTSEITTNIAPPSGPLPDDRSGGLTVSPINPFAVARTDALVKYQWEAPIVCHGPLYFDDVPLEHFGQSRLPWLEPAISCVKFAGNVIILPYKMALDPPRTPTYNLRSYPRPGTEVPCVRQTLPLRLKPLLVQAGVVLAIVFIIP